MPLSGCFLEESSNQSKEYVYLNRFADKTAIGIVTCNRPDFFKTLLESIDPSVGDIFVINAGDEFELDDVMLSSKITKFIKTNINPTAVGRAKNEILREMRHSGYEYLFLIEDDVKIKDNKVFEKYIEKSLILQ